MKQKKLKKIFAYGSLGFFFCFFLFAEEAPLKDALAAQKTEKIYQLPIGKRLFFRILNFSQTKKSLLINRGQDEGVHQGDHFNFINVYDGMENEYARGEVIESTGGKSIIHLYQVLDRKPIKKDVVMLMEKAPGLQFVPDKGVLEQEEEKKKKEEEAILSQFNLDAEKIRHYYRKKRINIGLGVFTRHQMPLPFSPFYQSERLAAGEVPETYNRKVKKQFYSQGSWLSHFYMKEHEGVSVGFMGSFGLHESTLIFRNEFPLDQKLWEFSVGPVLSLDIYYAPKESSFTLYGAFLAKMERLNIEKMALLGNHSSLSYYGYPLGLEGGGLFHFFKIYKQWDLTLGLSLHWSPAYRMVLSRPDPQALDELEMAPETSYRAILGVQHVY